MKLSREDQAFVEAYDPGQYERPSVTADTALFRIVNGEAGKHYSSKQLELLLIKRGQAPYQGGWALPGGFCNMDEALDEAARRELKEETGLEANYYGQVATSHRPDRDPRTRIITTTYLAILAHGMEQEPKAGDDADQAAWFKIEMDTEAQEDGSVVVRVDLQGPEHLRGKVRLTRQSDGLWARNAEDQSGNIAFDHLELIAASVETLRQYLYLTDLPYQFLPETFPLKDLQGIFEAIVGQPLLRTTLLEHIKGRIVPVDFAPGDDVLEHTYQANPHYRPPEGSLFIDLWRA